MRVERKIVIECSPTQSPQNLQNEMVIFWRLNLRLCNNSAAGIKIARFFPEPVLALPMSLTLLNCPMSYLTILLFFYFWFWLLLVFSDHNSTLSIVVHSFSSKMLGTLIHWLQFFILKKCYSIICTELYIFNIKNETLLILFYSTT